MKTKKITICLLLLVTMLLTAACGPSLPDGPITFTIPISPEIFSPEAVLRIQVWNEEQLKAQENNSLCSVSYDAQTGKETIDCPQGVPYIEVAPDIFTFPVSETSTEIQIVSQTLNLDEKYRLQISGLSRDQCNTTSASLDGTATTRTILVGELMWATTVMACP